MKSLHSILLSLVSLLPLVLAAQEQATQRYFSFEEVYQQQIKAEYQLKRFNSFDGVQIAYYQFEPAKASIATLVFIHGGGANSALGYLKLAETLSTEYAVRTLLMDLRGHGASAGRRGDAPTVDAVYQDISLLLDLAKPKDKPIYLGGHSSGAGTVLNYSSAQGMTEVDGYFFISPFLGESANTLREDPVVFFDLDVQKFIAYAQSGGTVHLNDYAVFFHYPPELLRAEPSMVSALTVSMSTATTPYAAPAQFAAITQPYGLFIGAEDEIFDANKVIAFDKLPTSRNINACAQIIDHANHLSILNKIGKQMGHTILSWKK